MYRIRWARVRRGETVERMCGAERKTRIGIWWPIGEWRPTENLARRDIETDKNLRKPLPTTVYVS